MLQTIAFLEPGAEIDGRRCPRWPPLDLALPEGLENLDQHADHACCCRCHEASRVVEESADLLPKMWSLQRHPCHGRQKGPGPAENHASVCSKTCQLGLGPAHGRALVGQRPAVEVGCVAYIAWCWIGMGAKSFWKASLLPAEQTKGWRISLL